MTIGDLLKIEIEETQKELDRLKSVLSNINNNDSALKDCPICKTKNYHYNPKTNIWVCAYC